MHPLLRGEGGREPSSPRWVGQVGWVHGQDRGGPPCFKSPNLNVLNRPPSPWGPAVGQGRVIRTEAREHVRSVTSAVVRSGLRLLLPALTDPSRVLSCLPRGGKQHKVAPGGMLPATRRMATAGGAPEHPAG